MQIYSKIFILFLFLVSGQVLGQVFQGRIISEKEPQAPIPFAQLHFIDRGIFIEADSAGVWQVNGISKGINRVEIAAVGYERIIKNIDFQEGESLDITLKHSHRQLDKIIVNNTGALQGESITNVEVHALSELNAIATTSIGEAIANIPGVSQTGIGAGIKKPVIRGLSGSSVVTYVNSLRIQNQQWGGDHGLPVTALGIGSVEVIKGPASLLYGADALGGVLYFVDEPFAPQNSIQGYVKTRVEYNSLGSSNEAGIKWSKNALKMNLYAGYDNFADYQLPNGMQLLNSRFKQSAVKFALGYNRKNWLINVRYNFYNGRIGLPGHTHDALPDPSSFQTVNQGRKNNVPAQVVQNHFSSIESKVFLGKHQLNLSIGNTNNVLKEHEEKFFTPDINVTLNNSLYNTKWKYSFSKKHQLQVGSQGMFQMNRNNVGAIEQLVPDANTLDVGGYALLISNLGKWKLQAGGRIDRRKINGVSTGVDFSELERSFLGYNYSIGGARIANKSTIRINLSSGFRAPTSSELLSDGVHHGSFRYEIGNVNLNPEQAVQIDVSLAVHSNDFELIINPFYNRISNYIFLEQLDTVIDGFKAYQYKQASFAELYGVDAGFHYHPHHAHWLHIESNLSSVFAQDKAKNPLPLIPQSRLNSQFRVELKSTGKFRIKNVTLQHLYFFKQNRTSWLETSSVGYHLLNLGANFEAGNKKPLLISVGARNVLNQAYIPHLSGLKGLGVQNPGVNFYISLKYKFSKQINKSNK